MPARTRTAPADRPVGGKVSWATGRADAVPGLDSGSACWEEWRGAIHLLVWGDYPEVETTSERNKQLLRYGGTFTFDADTGRPGLQVDPRRQLVFSCRADAPDAGTLTVGGQAYDLAKGRVFLLAGVRGPVRVKQLSRDPATVPVDKKSIEVFGRTDPEIAAFFSKDGE